VPEPQPEPAPRQDPLDLLRAQVRAVQEAAERLAARETGGAGGGGPADRGGGSDPAGQAGDPAGAGAAGGTPPPRGWDVPRPAEGQSRPGDLAALVAALVEALRAVVPRELQQPLADLLRELLLAVRAILDWYLERLDGRRAAPAEVEEIPID
jgi:hypothetical protein